MSGHVHAKLMALYAQDAMETERPWERWELLAPGRDWNPCEGHPSWNTAIKYRRKTITIHINGFEVPEPCREPLACDTKYYMPDIVDSLDGKWARSAWDDDEVDHARLKAGIVHLTKEAAEMHAKALVSFTEAKSCDE